MIRHKAFWVICALLLFYFFNAARNTGDIDWRKSYSAKDKIPYGCYLLYEEMNQLFPGEKKEVQNEPFINYLENSVPENPKNLFIIQDEIDFQETETDLLLEFAAQGNHVFMSARHFGESFEKKFNFNIKHDFSLPEDSSLLLYNISGGKKGKTFVFAKGHADPCFEPDSLFKGAVLGGREPGQPVYIRTAYGKGFFYFHLYPELLTNYNWLRNPDYVADVLGFLPSNHLWWDEFHKPFRASGKSHLDYIKNTRQLRSAWTVLYIGCILLLIFLAKRKQRPVPIIRPPSNDSLEFIRTLGNLYLREENHKEIAIKRLRYFYHHVHLHFRLNGENDDFWESLGRKSAWDTKECNKLRDHVKKLESSKQIRPDFLLEISYLIDNYYKTVKIKQHE